MVSEKTVYWMAVGLLALAGTNGLVSEYRGWAGRVANKSIAVAELASATAASYANLATPDRDHDNLGQLVQTQVRLARVRSVIARHQVEMARVQAEGIRAQVMGRRIRAAIDCPNQHFVIDIPRPPQVFADNTF